MKRVLSLLLVFSLCCTMFPGLNVTASAQEPESQGITTNSIALPDDPEKVEGSGETAVPSGPQAPDPEQNPDANDEKEFKENMILPESNEVTEDIEQSEDKAVTTPGIPLGLSQSSLGPLDSPDITAFAASASGTAIATVGYKTISVTLSSGDFSSNDGDVKNTANWTLNASGGQTIASIFYNTSNQKYVQLTLSSTIQQGETITIQADATVFEMGTDPFDSPISVTIYTPTPAVGSASATEGTKNITVTLSNASLNTDTAVEATAFWTLGGTSAAGNPIASVTKNSEATATITLTNNIQQTDNYTITFAQSVLVNASVAPPTSPFVVSISGAAPTVPTPPKNLSTASGNGFITLYWSAPDSDGGSQILKYEVSKDKGVTWVSAGTNTEYNFDNLTNGQPYILRVRAVNIVGESDYAEIYASTVSDSVCEIPGEGGFATFGGALKFSMDNGGRPIRLLENTTHPLPISVATIEVAFDLNGHNLILDTSGTEGSTALKVTNGGKVRFVGNGVFNVIGDSYGLVVDGTDSSATVSNVSAMASDSVGVSVTSNGKAEVFSSVSAGRTGISATGNCVVIIAGNVTVNGNAGITRNGVHANTSTVEIGGNVVQTGNNVGSGGVISVEGTVIVDGSITGYQYIKVGEGWREKSFGVTDASKPGYLKYSVPNEDPTAVVWVKDILATTYVCEISGTGYGTLPDALADVPTGGAIPTIIKLLENITHMNSIYISNKNITFDLNGKNLIIDTSAATGSTALGIVDGGSVNYTGNGVFNVIGADCGVASRDAGSTATVTTAGATGYDSDGVRASFGGSITVNGNVVRAGNCDDNNDSGYGISIIGGGSVTVNGSIAASGTGSQGMYLTGGTALVTGDVTAVKRGIYTYNAADITVDGNVTAISTNSLGIDAGGTSTVLIGGNVTASGISSIAVYANNFSGGSGGAVTIGGKVQSDDLGVHATDGGTVKIDGQLVASGVYIRIGNADKTYSDGVDATDSNYLEYTDTVSVVWVKKAPIVVVPTVITNPTTAVTSSSVSLSGNVTSDGGATIDEIGYVYSTNPNPVIGGAGTTRMTLSNPSMGTFNISISGLAANTTYYVRAYAHNSVGWGYGADVSFTTLSATPVTYSVTVSNGTGGGNYAQGATVTITANTAPSGQRFKEWNISPSVTFTGGTSAVNATAQFIMPAQVVTATAVYENIPVGTTPVTGVTINKTSISLYSNTTPNSATLTATVSPAAASDKTVTWHSGNTGVATVDANGKVTAVGNGTAIITVTTTDGGYTASCTVTVSTYSSGTGSSGSNGGGDSSSGSSYTTPAIIITTDKQPNMPALAKVSVTGTVKDKVLSATITEKMAKDAIAAVKDTGDGLAVQFNITGKGDFESVSYAFNRAALEAFKTAGVRYVQIGSAVIDLTLDTKTINAILSQTTGNVTVAATRQTKLSDAAKALIGPRPVFDITIKDSKGVIVSDLKGGAATIGIAYKPTTTEKTGNLYGVYVDKNGKPQLLTNSSYDNGRLIFKRGLLSVYGVGYKVPAPSFTDTSGHWAKNDIDFVTSRGLIAGTSATTFSPNMVITRADFLMALGKLSGTDVSGYKTSSFTDVKVTDPAMPYIEWAAHNKIVAGIGNNKFAPDAVITREQMAVMMVGYAKATNYTLPVSRQAVTFADDLKISSWAKDAVKAAQQTGVISGKPNNMFDPQGNATRAEASAMLRRFVELVIDEGTARGWVQDDVGQWQYINTNGKAITGWLTVAGTDIKYWFDDKGIMVTGKWVEVDGKWFYFYADGKMARNAMIDGYIIGENGARKE